MDLILWRHAEAEEATVSIPDMKRRLTPLGEKQAHSIAHWLRERQPKRLRILVSPSERTQQTAHALALPFEIEPKIGPGADVAALSAAIGWPDLQVSTLIVGHQPTLGRFAARLLFGQDDNLSIKKSGLWWFSRRMRDGEMRTTLRCVIGPDLV